MISVLLPVYNGEKYLKEAIDSVLNQTFKEFELLILDDGSTDLTNEIVLSYKDPRIKYTKFKHMGLPSVLNKGLNLAQYDYIARMDADDICQPTRLEKQLDFIINNPRIQLVGTNINIIDSLGNISGKSRRPKKNKYIKKSLPHTCCIVHGSILCYKKALLKVGGYETDSVVEDWSLFLKLIDKIEFHNLQDFLYSVRIHDDNVSSELINKNFRSNEEKLAVKFYQSQIEKRNIQGNTIAKAHFDLGYFYYLRDDERYREYFWKAVTANKTKFRYVYFLVVGVCLRSLVILSRKTGIIKLLNPLRKLDKNHLFFRREY